MAVGIKRMEWSSGSGQTESKSRTQGVCGKDIFLVFFIPKYAIEAASGRFYVCQNMQEKLTVANASVRS